MYALVEEYLQVMASEWSVPVSLPRCCFIFTPAQQRLVLCPLRSLRPRAFHMGFSRGRSTAKLGAVAVFCIQIPPHVC